MFRVSFVDGRMDGWTDGWRRKFIVFTLLKVRKKVAIKDMEVEV